MPVFLLICPLPTLVFEDGTKETQYYVHYEDRDRRLDEWIPISRILETIPLSARSRISRLLKTPSQPLTRSQRRIQEEFSHKQRSYEDMDATTAALEKLHEEVGFLSMF